MGKVYTLQGRASSAKARGWNPTVCGRNPTGGGERAALGRLRKRVQPSQWVGCGGNERAEYHQVGIQTIEHEVRKRHEIPASHIPDYRRSGIQKMPCRRRLCLNSDQRVVDFMAKPSLQPRRNRSIFLTKTQSVLSELRVKTNLHPTAARYSSSERPRTWPLTTSSMRLTPSDTLAHAMFRRDALHDPASQLQSIALRQTQHGLGKLVRNHALSLAIASGAATASSFQNPTWRRALELNHTCRPVHHLMSGLALARLGVSAHGVQIVIEALQQLDFRATDFRDDRFGRLPLLRPRGRWCHR